MVGLNLVASGKRPQLPGCAIILPAEALHNGIVIRKPRNSVTKIALTYRTTRKSRIGDTTLGSLEDDLSPAATEAGHLYVGYAAAREPISDTPLSAPFGRAQQGSDGRKTCAADEHDMRIDELEEFDFETADGDDPAGDETEAGSEALTDEDAWDKEARRRGDEFLADCGDTFLADQADDAGEDAPVRPATKRKLLEPGWLRVAPETICAFDPTAAEARFLSRVFRSDVQKHERASLKAALTGAPAFLTAAVFNKLIVNNLRPYAVAQALGISPHSVKKHLCRAIERMAEYEARPPVARASAPDFVTPPSILRYAFTVCASLTTEDAAPATANRRQIEENITPLGQPIFADERPRERVIDPKKLAAVTKKTDALRKLKPSEERPSPAELVAIATELLSANGFTSAECDLYIRRS